MNRAMPSPTYRLLYSRASHSPAGGDLSERVREVLATVFFDRDAAVHLALDAGIPRQTLPSFTTSRIFWAAVIAEANNGAIPDGLRRILDGALARYPNNDVLIACLGTLDELSVRPRPVHPKRRDDDALVEIPLGELTQDRLRGRRSTLGGIELMVAAVMMSLVIVGSGAAFAYLMMLKSLPTTVSVATSRDDVDESWSEARPPPQNDGPGDDKKHPTTRAPQQLSTQQQLSAQEQRTLRPPKSASNEGAASSTSSRPDPARPRRKGHRARRSRSTRPDVDHPLIEQTTTPACDTASCTAAEGDPLIAAEIRAQLAEQCRLPETLDDVTIKVSAIIGRRGRTHDIQIEPSTPADTCIASIVRAKHFMSAGLRSMPDIVVRVSHTD